MQRDDPSPGAGAQAVPDEQLWSWVDRDAPELGLHLERHPEDRTRVDELRRAIRAVAGDGRDERTPERIGPYPISRRLGSGGMGVVFEGTQVRTNRRVAIKVIRGAWLDDERTRRLFFREAEVLARLQHPGIAGIHDAGETKEGSPYFVMELVDGLPLDVWGEGRSLPEKLDVARQIAVAVEHAHGKGVIHRDLKPSNVLVTADGTAKVLDFGLARIVDPAANATLTAAVSGNVIGTVRYMSPEQARGLASKVTPASDVYSIGVLLYELTTGRLPHDFEGADLFECARKVAEERIAPPSKHVDSLPDGLDRVVCQALAKDPSKRYESAAALGEDIGRVLDGTPVRARDASGRGEDLGELFGRWGVEIGSAIGRASAEIGDATKRAWNADKAKACKERAVEASHKAKERATVASRKAGEAAKHAAAKVRAGARRASDSWEARRERGDTVHIDLNPAIDAVAKGAEVTASAARTSARGVAAGSVLAWRGVKSVIPRRGTVLRWAITAAAICAFVFLAANGFEVDRAIDEFAHFVSEAAEGALDMTREVWREIF